MACLRWNPVTATNSSRMRPFSARLPVLYRSMTAATRSSRVTMLTRLITDPPTPSGSGAFQMRQQINIREHFWRGNAGLELVAPGVFLIWLGLAAVLTGLLDAALGLSWQTAVLTFAVLAVASVIVGWMVTRSRHEDEGGHPTLNRRGHALVSRVFTLE